MRELARVFRPLRDIPVEAQEVLERDRGFADSPLEEDGFELPVPRKVDDAFETAVFASGHLPFRRPTYSRGSNPLSSARFDIDFT